MPKGETYMIKIDCEYSIGDDIEFLLEAEKMNVLDFSAKTKISRTTLDSVIKSGKARADVCEKVYSYAYKMGYRLNTVKEELRKEKYRDILFHGSKEGLSEVTAKGSRSSCDFGAGFYLGESFNQALSFVCEKDKSSVYSFRYSLEGLKIKRFDCNLEWMLAICYFRGGLKEYASNHTIQRIIEEVESSDVIIAPIADNKMFYVMTQFADGDINADVALHSLSASRLGLQYIFRTDNALDKLIPIERYYLSVPERTDCRRMLNERSNEIDTKLKLAKRDFKNGLYIEELLG